MMHQRQSMQHSTHYSKIPSAAVTRPTTQGNDRRLLMNKRRDLQIRVGPETLASGEGNAGHTSSRSRTRGVPITNSNSLAAIEEHNRRKVHTRDSNTNARRRIILS